MQCACTVYCHLWPVLLYLICTHYHISYQFVHIITYLTNLYTLSHTLPICTHYHIPYQFVHIITYLTNLYTLSHLTNLYTLSHTLPICTHYHISHQFSNDVEFKLTKFLQLIGTIKRTIFRKVRTETILKIYNTLVLPAFYMGQKTGL